MPSTAPAPGSPGRDDWLAELDWLQWADGDPPPAVVNAAAHAGVPLVVQERAVDRIETPSAAAIDARIALRRMVASHARTIGNLRAETDRERRRHSFLMHLFRAPTLRSQS